jgi:hypothetical protein
MKKKYRDITVDNKQYAWKVSNGKVLIIWYKKIIFNTTDVSEIDAVTPKYVSELIKSL